MPALATPDEWSVSISSDAWGGAWGGAWWGAVRWGRLGNLQVEVVGHLDDIVASVSQSPNYLDEVA